MGARFGGISTMRTSIRSDTAKRGRSGTIGRPRSPRSAQAGAVLGLHRAIADLAGATSSWTSTNASNRLTATRPPKSP